MNPTLEQLRAGLTRAQEAGDTEAAEVIQGRIKKNPQALYEGYERAGQAGDLEAAREIRKRHLGGFKPQSDDDLAADPFWNKEAKTLYKAFNYEGGDRDADPDPQVAHKWALDFMSKQNWGEVTPGHTLYKFATEDVDPEVAAAFLNASDAYNATPISLANTKRALTNVLNPAQSPSITALGLGKVAGKAGAATMSKALRSKLEKRIAEASLRNAVSKDLLEKGVTTTGMRTLGKNAATGGAIGAGHGGVLEGINQTAMVDAGEQESVDGGAIVGNMARVGAGGMALGGALAGPAALRARRNYKAGGKASDEFAAQRNLDATTRLQQAAAENSGDALAARDMTDITAKIKGGTATSEDVVNASRIAKDAGKGKSSRWSAEVGSAATKSAEQDLKAARSVVEQGLKRGEITSADAAEIAAIVDTAKLSKGSPRVATLKEILPRTKGDTQKAVETLIGAVEPSSALAKTRNVYQQGSKVGEFLDQPGVQVLADVGHIPGAGPLGNLSLLRRGIKAFDPMLSRKWPAGKNVKSQIEGRARAEDIVTKRGLRNTQETMKELDTLALADVTKQRDRVAGIHSGLDAQIAARNAPKPPMAPRVPRKSAAQIKEEERLAEIEAGKQRFRQDLAIDPKEARVTAAGGIQSEWAQTLGISRNAGVKGLRVIEKRFIQQAGKEKDPAKAIALMERAQETKKFREAYAANLNTKDMPGLGGEDAYYRLQNQIDALAKNGIIPRMSIPAQQGFRATAGSTAKGAPAKPIPQVFQKENRRSGQHGPSGAALRKWQQVKEQSRTIKTPARDVGGERAQNEFLAQMNWLNEQAKAAGYADLDELGAKDPDLLGKLSAAWREAQGGKPPEAVKEAVKPTGISPAEKAQRRAKAKKFSPLPKGPPPMPKDGVLTPVEAPMPKPATPLPAPPAPARPTPKKATPAAVPEAPKAAPEVKPWQPRQKSVPMSPEARAAIARAQAKVATDPLAGKSKEEMEKMLKELSSKKELTLEEAKLRNKLLAALKS